MVISDLSDDDQYRRFQLTTDIEEIRKGRGENRTTTTTIKITTTAKKEGRLGSLKRDKRAWGRQQSIRPAGNRVRLKGGGQENRQGKEEGGGLTREANNRMLAPMGMPAQGVGRWHGPYWGQTPRPQSIGGSSG